MSRKSVNKVILIGHLGQNPESGFTKNDTQYCRLSLATSEFRKDQDKEQTEWHKVVVWGKAAEFADKYLTKGDLVYVEGKLQTRNWEGDDGKKRYSTEVIAFIINALGNSKPKTEEPKEPDGDFIPDDDGEDLPF
jgi:single-strand DNA-binding protein